MDPQLQTLVQDRRWRSADAYRRHKGELLSMTYRKALSTAAAALFGVAIQLPTIQAQSRICGGNNVISGSYGVAASRAGFFLLGATAPTTSTAGTGSTIG